LDGVKPVRAVVRAMRVLEALKSPQGLNDLHEETGLDRATLLRILRTLRDEGFVMRSLATGTYELTPKVASIASHIRGQTFFTAGAGRVLDRLCRDLLWPSDLAIPQDGAMIAIETSRRQAPLLSNPVALHRPISVLQSAMGQAWLAYCGDEERNDVIERIVARRLESEAIREDYIARIITETRSRGYGARVPGYTAFPESWGNRMHAIAVPILVRGKAVAALNLVWIATYATVEEMAKRHLERLRSAAFELEPEVAATS